MSERGIASDLSRAVFEQGQCPFDAAKMEGIALLY
jgi:hypothetical protein